MLIDAKASFLPPFSTLAVLGVAVRSQIVDLLGSGVGTPPQNIIGNVTTFGADPGIGGIRPQFQVAVGQAFVGGGVSLNVAYQAAKDLGAPTYQPDTWVTINETGPIPVAELTLDQILAKFDFQPNFPQNLRPRYLSLLLTPSGGAFTAGYISSIPVTLVRDDPAQLQVPNNYSMGPLS